LRSEVVLFDIGNVLVKLKYEDFLDRAASASRVGRQDLHAEFSGPDRRHHALERGELSLEDFHRGLVERFGLVWDLPEFSRQFNDFFLPNPPMEALLDALKPQARLWALSNTNAGHLEHLRTNFSVVKRLEGVLASHELRLRKPDPAIFAQSLEALDVPGSQVSFLDDSAANVAAAKAAGMRAFHYTFNNPELHLFLRSSGFQLS
jgi:putative hydrolase of the HAD superfamily